MSKLNWDQIINKKGLEQDGLKFDKAEYNKERKNWVIYMLAIGNGGRHNSWIDQMRPTWLQGPFQFLDEKVPLNSRVMFVPKNVMDLKAEGWTEGDRAQLLKGPFWMGKKKQVLLGKASTGIVQINQSTRLSIACGGYYFTSEQVKFILPPTFNNNAVNKIRDAAQRLTEDNCHDFFKSVFAAG